MLFCWKIGLSWFTLFCYKICFVAIYDNDKYEVCRWSLRASWHFFLRNIVNFLFRRPVPVFCFGQRIAHTVAQSVSASLSVLPFAVLQVFCFNFTSCLFLFCLFWATGCARCPFPVHILRLAGAPRWSKSKLNAAGARIFVIGRRATNKRCCSHICIQP